jgi:phosphoribosylaminoimidazole-succinocarboxamide synthase
MPGWTHAYSGKVRDLYVPTGQYLDSAPRILVVASDRVSAFDHVLEPGIPGKGALLTRLSTWWFSKLGVPNHLRKADANTPPVPAHVAASSMLVANLDMFPIEAVVRGYLTGSGWLEYQATQSVCGVALPAGLNDGDKLPEPIYTPAWKAPLGEHDENITFEQTVEMIGLDLATRIRDISIAIYTAASAIAFEKGILIADTKFEFGLDDQGTLVLMDEVLTPDSSRYWPAESYQEGINPPSYDKQFLRDWLEASHNGKLWDKTAPAPHLPRDVIEKTAVKYQEALQRLTT